MRRSNPSKDASSIRASESSLVRRQRLSAVGEMFRDAAASPHLRVKICGITNAADAAAAIECGADALGFNCYQGSKRYLDLAKAGVWIADLPEHVSKIAVVVNPELKRAVRTAQLPFIDALQLHGNESPQFCERLADLGIRFGKALPAMNAVLREQAAEFSTDTIVLDSSSRASFGGSGETFPWSVAAEFRQTHPQLRLVLAGGLSPENVAEAVRLVRPFGVDVTSGTEATAGRKHPGLLRAFIAAARAA